MPDNPISLGTQSNPGRTPHISAARLINCYVENAGEEGKTTLPLVAIDSYEEWVTLPFNGTIRAMLAVDSNTLYVVSGTRLYKIDASKAVTVIGTIALTSNVTMAANVNGEVGIALTNGYYYTTDGATLTTRAHSGAKLNDTSGNVVAVTHLDGYLIVGIDNGEFFISDYQDATSYPALDFETAEKHPDGINMVAVRAGELVIFGPNSTEFYSNTGNADFPFERSASAEYGCYAGASVCKVAGGEGEATSDTLMFAASNADGSYAGVAIMTGYGRRLVSVPDLDKKIEAETDKSVITAMTWTRRGHVFYAISGTDWTYCYDLRTGRWHERQSSGQTYYFPKRAVQFGTTKLLGHGSSNVIYAIDDTIATTVASQAKLSYSKDGGHTFSTARAKTASTTTNTTERFKWNRVGTSKEDGKVLKIEITNAWMADGVGTSMIVIPPAVHAWPKRVRFNNVRVDLVPGISTSNRAKAITGLSANTDLVGG